MSKEDWFVFDTLIVPSGRLSFSDTSYFFDSFVVVAVPPGPYNVAILRSKRGSIALLRVVREAGCTRGRKVGRISVDFAQVGVCDRDSTESAFQARTNDEMRKFFDALVTDEFGVIDLGDIHMAFSRSGLGDGRYEVWELVDQEEHVCGAEIDFRTPK
jgi:hypothetical protein